MNKARLTSWLRMQAGRSGEYDRVFFPQMPLLFEAGANFVNSVAGDARDRYERFKAAECLVAR